MADDLTIPREIKTLAAAQTAPACRRRSAARRTCLKDHGAGRLASGIAERQGDDHDVVERAPDGELLILDAGPRDGETGAALQSAYTTAVEAEWQEFLADCDKYSAELRREIEIEKFTLAELEEEERSLERLRRWHRTINMRDRFGVDSAQLAHDRLQTCSGELDSNAEQVYLALGQ